MSNKIPQYKVTACDRNGLVLAYQNTTGTSLDEVIAQRTAMFHLYRAQFPDAQVYFDKL